VREVEVLEESAHHRELEMRVDVHESREEECIAEVRVHAARRAGTRADVRDATVGDRDGAVLDRRRADGEHPPRVIADHEIRTAGACASYPAGEPGW
jgi:hypothetical protein